MREAVTSLPGNPLQRIPGVAITLVLLVAVFGSLAPGFLSPANITNVLVQSTVLMMLALPMTLIIMTEGLDLSMGAVLTFTSLVVAIVSLATGSMLFGLGGAILAGAAFGIVNGWLVATLGIPPFVATLGTLGTAHIEIVESLKSTTKSSSLAELQGRSNHFGGWQKHKIEHGFIAFE
jgi:ribose transport system permease protein